ncbi:acriflavin resistance protein B [Citrobacter koseri]|nr:acriflavin resistance protein B [Citrobacter koseri]
MANGATDRDTLLQMRNQLIAQANQSDILHAVRANDLPQMPQLQVDIDSNKAVSLGLGLSDVTSTLSSAWGGTYVNDFIDRGRVKKVYIQGDSEFRSSPADLGKWFVRGSDNSMTPFSAFATTRWEYGPESLVRYNGSAAYEIQGENASGFSSGAAMDKMEALANSLPAGTTWAWSGLSLQEKLASGQAMSLYAISILVVFLCLAALYESWSVPFSVILVIPLGLLGAALAAWMRDLNNDVLLPGRAADHHRPVVEKRHSDRRICRSCGRGRLFPEPGCAASGADPFTPNHYDLSGLYCRGYAAGYRHRGRGEQPCGDRDRNHRWDINRHAVGYLLRPAVLRAG